MDVLYHYCSVEAFLSIIQSKTLRLSDASQMNDSHELIWGDGLVQELLASKKGELSDEEILQVKLGYEVNRKKAFVFCLSSEPDILSQWRAYADDGTGVAIGFSTSTFPQHNHPLLSNISPEKNTALRQVLYPPAKQQDLMKSTFESALAEQRRLNLHVKGEGVPMPPSEFQVVGAVLTGVAPILKNPKFEEEREWRLIHTPFIRSLGNGGLDFLGTAYKAGQRVSNRRIVTYFEYPFEKHQVASIVQIWLGPRSSMDPADVAIALSLNGFGNVSVVRSSATYRR